MNKNYDWVILEGNSPEEINTKYDELIKKEYVWAGELTVGNVKDPQTNLLTQKLYMFCWIGETVRDLMDMRIVQSDTLEGLHAIYTELIKTKTVKFGKFKTINVEYLHENEVKCKPVYFLECWIVKFENKKDIPIQNKAPVYTQVPTQVSQDSKAELWATCPICLERWKISQYIQCKCGNRTPPENMKAIYEQRWGKR